MRRLSDDELMAELKRRFSQNREMLQSMNEMTAKLQAVNQKLLQSERLKTDFLSNIRNEINNPLTAILGICENLMGEPALDANTVTEMMGMIHLEAFNLDFQLRTIFAAAELEAGEARLHVSRVNLHLMLHRVVNSFKALAASKSVSFHLETEADEESEFDLLTDSEKLHLILSNLINNAVEYSERGGKIIIKNWRENEVHFISVQDFGSGVAYEDQTRIFDRFVQLDTGLTKKHKGHGLGLSVTRAAIEMLKGSISVRSEVGCGSLFTITIPQIFMDEKTVSMASDGNEELF